MKDEKLAVIEKIFKEAQEKHGSMRGVFCGDIKRLISESK